MAKTKSEDMIYKEYNENGWLIRLGTISDYIYMYEDVLEFGGFITDRHGKYIAGFKWAYDAWKGECE